MKQIKIFVAACTLLVFYNSASAQQKLIHYWHFNNFTGVSAAADPASLAPVYANYSGIDTAKAFITYRVTSGTSAAYKTYWDGAGTGDTVNARLGFPAGNFMRLRNPADSMQLVFAIPSTLYKNISIKFNVQKSSASNGSAVDSFYYSTDSGSTWKTSGLSLTYFTTTTAWPLTPVSITITDTLAANNPRLMFRMRFSTSGSTGTSGNNRIDNFTVDGDTIVYPFISAAESFGPFTAEKNGFSAAQSFSLTGVNLTDTLHISAPAHFMVSLTGTGTYVSSLAILPAAGSVSRTVFVKFNPSDTGTFSGSIILSSGGAVTKALPVSGTTLPVPAISVSGLPLSTFPNTQPGDHAVSAAISLNAVNLADSLSITSSGAFLFSLSASFTQAVASLKIAGPAVAQQVYVFFAPGAFGVFNDSIVIVSTGANRVVISLAGSSIAKPVFTLSGLPVASFPEAKVGENTTARAFTVTGANLTGNISVSVTAPFQVSSDSVSFQNSVVLIPSSGSISQNVYVRFSPVASGAVSDSLVITSADTGTLKFIVSGTTLDPFAGMQMLYQQDFSGSSNAALPDGWSLSDSTLWSVVSSNPSSGYAFASGGNCLRFDNELSDLPKTAYATLSAKLNTTGFKDIDVIWGARRTNNFFNGIVNNKAFFQYSIDGVTWDTVYYTPEPNNSNLWSYVNNTVPVRLPAKANHRSDVRIRWFFTGEGIGSSGTYRMDDVKIFGTTETVSSTEELSGRRNFILYPNPAVSGEPLQIVSDEAISEISLYDLTARLVYHEVVSGVSTSVSVAAPVPAGTYIVRVKTGSELRHSKLIIR